MSEQETELVELLGRGLSPAEAVDYWATETLGFNQTEWANRRDTSRQAVSKNIKKAKEKLE